MAHKLVNIQGDVYKAYPSFALLDYEYFTNLNERTFQPTNTCKVQIRTQRYGGDTLFEFVIYPNKNGEFLIDLTDYIAKIEIPNSRFIYIEATYDDGTNIVTLSDMWDIYIRSIEDVYNALIAQPPYFVGENYPPITTNVCLANANSKVYLPPSYLLFADNIDLTQQNAMKAFYVHKSDKTGDAQNKVLRIHQKSKSGSSIYSDLIAEMSFDTLTTYNDFVSLFKRTATSYSWIELSAEDTSSGSGSNVVLLHPIRLKCTLPNRRYARVRWMNRLGQEQFFMFEVKNLKKIITDTVEIDNNTGEMYTNYVVKRKYKYGGSLFLDELRAYDVWFYADIVTAPHVYIRFFSFYNEEDPEQPIKITTEEIEVPTIDDAGPFTIEIEFEYYDSYNFL